MLGKRLQRARKAQGLSLRDLAGQLDLSHAAIKKYEDNKVTPSSDMLFKLAKALHVKVEFFFRPEHPALTKIRYRKHADMPDKHLEEITAQISDQIGRRIELENLFPSPPVHKFSVPKFNKFTREDDIEEMACKIRKEWKLGLEPVLDLIDVLEEHGIKVFEIDNQRYPKFDGLFADMNGNPFIVVSNHGPGDRQRFTLAHELGHLLLDDCISNKMDKEKVCNRFAGAFLLPKESLVNKFGEHRNSIEPRELDLLKQEFGVSMTAILHRAADTKIISPNLYRQLRAEFDERGWTKREPGQQYPREKPHIFEQMIFHALAEEYIGESKAAELMDMPLESFRSLRAMEYPKVVCHQ